MLFEESPNTELWCSMISSLSVGFCLIVLWIYYAPFYPQAQVKYSNNRWDSLNSFRKTGERGREKEDRQKEENGSEGQRKYKPASISFPKFPLTSYLRVEKTDYTLLPTIWTSRFSSSSECIWQNKLLAAHQINHIRSNKK